MAFIAGNMDASPVILNLGVDFAEDFLAFLKGEEVFYFCVLVVFDCVDELFICSFLFLYEFSFIFMGFLLLLLFDHYAEDASKVFLSKVLLELLEGLVG